MEPMQCEETSRAAILELLKRRELFVPNAENLSAEQLQQIYHGFAVPQPRRERRERTLRKTLPMEMENLMQRIKVVYVVGEKRSCSSADRRSEEALQLHSSEPKRVKHNSSHVEDVDM